jgi:hypothetical protein
MNIELLEQVKRGILTEPSGFDMREYHKSRDCGTTMCIAGCAVAISYPQAHWFPAGLVQIGREFHTVAQLAATLLYLRPFEASNLFHVDNWPSPWKGNYIDAERNQDHILKAQVAAEYIDHLIAKETNA